jgi:general secretion pathway protein D
MKQRMILLLAVCGLMCGGRVAAQEGNEPLLRFQFKDADVDSVLKSLSKSLGMTFIQEVSVEGKKLTAVSDRPVPRERAIAFLNSALIQHGVAAVQVGEVVKIVTLDEAKKISHAIRYGSDPEKVQHGDEIITQIIPLEVLDAESVKKELGELTSRTGQFLLNTKANVIVLTDTESNVKRFLAIINQLDKAVKEVLKLRIFRLKHANAEEVAQAIDRLFEPVQPSSQGRGGRGGDGGGDPRQRMMQMWMGAMGGGNQADAALRSSVVRTTVEKRSNTLIVQANDSSMRQIDELIAELDQAMTELVVIRPYQLEFAQAAQVAEVVKAIFMPEQTQTRNTTQAGGQMGRFQQMMRMMRPQGGGDGGEGETEGTIEQVKVTHDERTNTVIVSASRQNQELVAALVEGLDRKVDPDQEVRIYTLRNADSVELQRILGEIFELQNNRTGTNQRTAASQQQARFNQQGFFQQGGAGQQGGARQQGGNMQQGTRQQGGARQQGPRGEPGGQGEAGQPGPGAPPPGGPDDEDDKDDDEEPGEEDAEPGTPRAATEYTPGGNVKVSSDSRTNSLVITAAKEDFAAIERIIRQLDSDNADLESTLVVKLLNANADQMQSLLSNLFDNNEGRGGQGGQASRPGQTTTSVGGLSGQVRVRADADSNSLVFVTASRNFETLRRLVAELDAERPQVLIRALIVEVDLDDTTELGVEWSKTFLTNRGTTNERTDTVSTDFDVAERTPGAFRWNQIKVDDREILLRALRQDGKLSVLSAPRILVQDNEEATINVGSEVPFVTNTRLTNEGTTLNTIQYRDIGIILTVTPSINPQGLVKMVVSPEISEIAPESQSVQITEGVRSPVFLKNNATTTVTIRDGQTIVLGGLIQDRVREAADKVPLLGDIPLLGYFFSSRRTEKKKVELLIFITPYVVNQSDELRQLTASEIAHFRMIPSRELIHESLPRLPTVILND